MPFTDVRERGRGLVVISNYSWEIFTIGIPNEQFKLARSIIASSLVDNKF